MLSPAITMPKLKPISHRQREHPLHEHKVRGRVERAQFQRPEPVRFADTHTQQCGAKGRQVLRVLQFVVTHVKIAAVTNSDMRVQTDILAAQIGESHHRHDSPTEFGHVCLVPVRRPFALDSRPPFLRCFYDILTF